MTPPRKTALDPIFEHAPIPYAIFDAQGHPERVNPAYRAMFQATPPPEYSVLQDELLESMGYLPLFERAYQGETLTLPTFWYDPHELKHIDAPDEAQKVAFSITLIPLQVSRKRAKRLAVAYRDVTAELRATATARGSERRFRSLIEAISEIVWYTPSSGEFVDPQPSWSAFTGQTQEEYSGYGWVKAVHPEDRSNCLNVWKTALSGREAASMDLRLRRADGVYRHMNVRAVPVVSDDGQVHEWVGIHRDITSRIVLGMRDQLVRRRETLLARAADQLFSSLDVETTLTRISRLVVQELAHACLIDLLDPSGQLAPRAVAHHDPEKDRALQDIHNHQGLSATVDLRMNAVALRKAVTFDALDNAALKLRGLSEAHLAQLESIGRTPIVSVPLLLGDKVLGVLTLTEPPTGEPFSEEDLGLFEQFASRAALAIEHSRLYEEAHVAISMRDEFLSIASHELKTPMTALSLHLAALEKALTSGKPSDALPRLVTLRRQVGRMALLVEGLLDVSRLARGKLELFPEPLDLAKLAGDLVSRLSPEAQRAGCTLELSAPLPVQGKWDPLRLEQVISNLVSNAIKYGHGKPVMIRVTGRGSMASLSVQDQGIGIPPEDLERIFGRFERAVSEKHYGGLGLGLFVSQQIVEAMGGSIRVQSQPGAGSTFTVQLPRRYPEPSPPPP